MEDIVNKGQMGRRDFPLYVHRKGEETPEVFYSPSHLPQASSMFFPLFTDTQAEPSTSPGRAQ